MSKKHFIALADMIREHNRRTELCTTETFGPSQIEALAEFCRRENSQFNRSRWIAYIAGECGPNGGTIRASKAA